VFYGHFGEHEIFKNVINNVLSRLTWWLWCPLRLPHKKFGSSLPPVVCRKACVLFTLFLFVFVFCMVLISLDCPFWIAPSVYSNVYLKSSDQYFSYIRDEVLWTYFYIWRYMMDRLWTTHDHCLIDCCLLWLLEIALTCRYSNTSHSFIYCPKG